MCKQFCREPRARDYGRRVEIDINTLPQEVVMETEDMVDAALAGLDQGERVTIPALPDVADWTAFKSARAALGPNLSHRLPAERYGSRNSG